MTPTRRAREIAEARARDDVDAQKRAYREKLQRLQALFDPPLSNAELSVALGLEAPAPGQPGHSAVGRFVSEAPRLRNARPDAAARGTIDALIDGDLLLAASPPPAPGARRATLVLCTHDLTRLAADWTVYSATEGIVRHRRDAPLWESAGAWDMFGHAEPTRTSGAKRWIADREVQGIGLGAMRLSTEPDVDIDAVLDAAIARGVSLIDTANVYCSDEADLGHNERAIRDALSRAGAADEVLVATKVGLARPGGRWVPDGAPERLTAAVEASVEALGGRPLDLVQLHAVDPRTPLEASVSALFDAQRRGLAQRVGLCNVSVEQLERAVTLGPIDSVQNAFSVVSPRDQVRSGLIARCHELGIAYIAHSPLGGHRRKAATESLAAARATARRLGVTPQQVALAWLLSLGPGVSVIPGATRVASLADSLAAGAITLDDEALTALDAAVPGAAELRERTWALGPLVAEGVVLVMGRPASGKSTRVASFERRGYERFNRDERGGTLAGLLPLMDAAMDAGARRIVADNTYPTRASRVEVARLAERHGLATAALWIDIDEVDAQRNACQRMIERRGRLLEPEEITAASRKDPNLFPPAALHRFGQIFEPPTPDEGLAGVLRQPFVRRAAAGERAAVILDYDGTLRATRSGAPYPTRADDVVVLPGRADALQALRDAGVLLLGVSNQSGVAAGALSAEQADALFAHTNALLGVEIDVRYCPHSSSRGRCWCRKPLPGLGVTLTVEYELDPARCVYVGDLETDAEFAHAAGFSFATADEFFADGWRDALPPQAS